MENSKPISLDPYIVKKARKAEGHTQDSLANALELTTRQIKRIEKNGQTSSSTADALCNALNVSLEHLKGSEGIDSYLPYYWYTSYFLTGEKLGIWQQLGKTFHLPGHLLADITAKIDESFNPHNISPCKYKVSATLTEDKSQNIFFVDVACSDLRFPPPAISPPTYRFEIRPFRFDETGMKWSAYCLIENMSFQPGIELCLERYVTEYITDELPEVKDPYYSIEFFPQVVKSDLIKYFMSKKAKLFCPLVERWPHEKDRIVDILDTCIIEGSTQNKYDEFIKHFPESKPIGPFLFDTIEQAEGFLHEVLHNYKPTKIERKSKSEPTVKLISQSPSTSLDVVLNITRVSKSQDRVIPWPSKHRDCFFDSLSKVSNDSSSVMLSSGLNFNALNILANKHGVKNEN